MNIHIGVWGCTRTGVDMNSIVSISNTKDDIIMTFRMGKEVSISKFVSKCLLVLAAWIGNFKLRIVSREQDYN